MRRPVSRRVLCEAVRLSRQISRHGVCSTHSSRKPSRYRGLPPRPSTQAVSHGHSCSDCGPQYVGQDQRASRLAHLCRFPHSLIRIARPSMPTRIWGSNSAIRSMPSTPRPSICVVGLSLGLVSVHQVCCQASYPPGPAWQHSDLYPYLRRQTPRCQRPRYPVAGTRRLLHHGPRLCGLPTPLCSAYGREFLCHPRQVQYQVPASLLSSGGQIRWRPVRSDHRTDRPRLSDRLPASTSPYQVPRCADRQEFNCRLTICCPPQTISNLYRYRWQVELFFKWIKQHLRIKTFFGTSENAVKSQIWIAISVYVLVASSEAPRYQGRALHNFAGLKPDFVRESLNRITERKRFH